MMEAAAGQWGTRVQTTVCASAGQSVLINRRSLCFSGSFRVGRACCFGSLQCSQHGASKTIHMAEKTADGSTYVQCFAGSRDVMAWW